MPTKARAATSVKNTRSSRRTASGGTSKSKSTNTRTRAGPARAASKQAKAEGGPKAKVAPKTSPARKASKAVTGKRGLRGHAAPDSHTSTSVVDPTASLGASAVLVHDENTGAEMNAMLNQLDLSKNMDKYYLLQVVRVGPKPSKKKKGASNGKGRQKASAASDEFYFIARWGRTGTSGTSNKEGPFDDVDDAAASFMAKFLEKTGNNWDTEDEEDRYVSHPGKYTCLRPSKAPVMPTPWQYWVDDGVDGKADGWYDYDDPASAVVEQLYSEFLANPLYLQRVVASGDYSYLVDLKRMTQTNVVLPARKTRHIRRNPSRSLPDTPPSDHTGDVKQEGEDQSGTGSEDASAPTSAGAGSTTTSGSSAEVDKCCPKAGDDGVSVCDGHDVKLNQTNISQNNNKFYILQMCRDAGRGEWFVWSRWGRVGETGATKELGPFTSEAPASAAFAKKFKEKTGNKWEDARNGKFEAVAGKYELIETDNVDPEAALALSNNLADRKSSSARGPIARVLPCKLEAPTKELVELVFSEDMFKSAMSKMNVDVQKMPLGQLSKAQVQRGYAVLEELEEALGSRARNKAKTLETLSAKFYQVIPHAFGRTRPPVIDTKELLSSKVEMLNVLEDIGEAQSMLSSTDSAGEGKGGGKKAEASPPAVPHPTDVNYGLLNAELKLVDPESHEFKAIKSYLENTRAKDHYGYLKTKMGHLWSVDREGEAERFKLHDDIENRKLLWHGTNVAVVAAIVKGGLRIMPHSGGRVGRGIYFASENAKSRQYVQAAMRANGSNATIGIMFLCEVALGKESTITRDNGSLKRAPKGFDSVVARGSQEPDPSKDKQLTIEGKQVTVPQGKPIPVPAYSNSNFFNSEYLVYQESQQRIRYMMTIIC